MWNETREPLGLVFIRYPVAYSRSSTEKGFHLERLSRSRHKVQLTGAWYNRDATLLSSNPRLPPACDRISIQARKYRDKGPPSSREENVGDCAHARARYRQTSCLRYVWLHRPILANITRHDGVWKAAASKRVVSFFLELFHNSFFYFLISSMKWMRYDISRAYDAIWRIVILRYLTF